MFNFEFGFGKKENKQEEPKKKSLSVFTKGNLVVFIGNSWKQPEGLFPEINHCYRVERIMYPFGGQFLEIRSETGRLMSITSELFRHATMEERVRFLSQEDHSSQSRAAMEAELEHLRGVARNVEREKQESTARFLKLESDMLAHIRSMSLELNKLKRESQEKQEFKNEFLQINANLIADIKSTSLELDRTRQTAQSFWKKYESEQAKVENLEAEIAELKKSKELKTDFETSFDQVDQNPLSYDAMRFDTEIGRFICRMVHLNGEELEELFAYLYEILRKKGETKNGNI